MGVREKCTCQNSSNFYPLQRGGMPKDSSVHSTYNSEQRQGLKTTTLDVLRNPSA
jgi:hypothetical protein